MGFAANDTDWEDVEGEEAGRSCRVTPEGGRLIAAIMTISAADQMLADGAIEAGIAAYRKAIDICPSGELRADFQLLLGTILFEQGDAAAAATEMAAARDGDCTHLHEALRRFAFARVAQGDFIGARQAMMDARAAGEDPAFAAQAMIVFDLALDGPVVALGQAAAHSAQGDAEVGYRVRLALARAELQRLTGNRAAALVELELVAELAQHDALDAELALWLAALDRYFGRARIRPAVDVAFAAEADHWATLAWKILEGEGSRAALEQHLAGSPATISAENLAIFDRLAGLAAEAAGDIAAARAAYERARMVPFTQWCIDYHLAGAALAAIEATP